MPFKKKESSLETLDHIFGLKSVCCNLFRMKLTGKMEIPKLHFSQNITQTEELGETDNREILKTNLAFLVFSENIDFIKIFGILKNFDRIKKMFTTILSCF